jgi:hypothetical protein
MTLLALASILVYLHAKAQTGSYRQFVLAFSSGLLLGLATSAKEPAAFLGIGFAIHVVTTEAKVSRWICVLTGITLGAAVVLAAEAIGFLFWTGDALFRFHVSSQTFGPVGWWKNSFSLRECASYVLECFDSMGAFGIHGILLLGGSLLAINRRSGASALPLIACAILATYLSIGSGSLTQYVLIPHQPRYFHVVMVIGCGLMGIELYEMGRSLKLKTVVAVAAAAAIAVVSLWAAKEQEWRGTVPVAKWLADPANQLRDAELFLLESFAPRQALELRAAAQRFQTIPVRASQSSSGAFTVHIDPESIDSLPAGSGIVVDRFKWITPLGEENFEQFEVELLQYRGHSFREEKIFGPSWPPYKRWIGVGEQQNMIGRIWWLEPNRQQANRAE